MSPGLDRQQLERSRKRVRTALPRRRLVSWEMPFFTLAANMDSTPHPLDAAQRAKVPLTASGNCVRLNVWSKKFKFRRQSPSPAQGSTGCPRRDRPRTFDAAPSALSFPSRFLAGAFFVAAFVALV